MIQEQTKMENLSLSGDLALSLSSSLHLKRPPSSLHRSTPASPPTRVTFALLFACRRTFMRLPRTRRHLFCPLCEGGQGSTFRLSSPTWRATKSFLRPWLQNLQHAACCVLVCFCCCFELKKHNIEAFWDDKTGFYFLFSVCSDSTPPVLPIVTDAAPVSLEPWVQTSIWAGFL